jgi:putative addiction module antidote protein, CC2985 family
MQTMNIALPDALKDYVQQQVQEQGYSSASEYVRELIRAAQKEEVRRKLEAEILLGLQSGAGEPLTSEDWRMIRQEVQKRHQERSGKKR